MEDVVGVVLFGVRACVEAAGVAAARNKAGALFCLESPCHQRTTTTDPAQTPLSHPHPPIKSQTLLFPLSHAH